MGDGGCSVKSNDRSWYYYKQDVCGDKAPFYWRADSKGRKYRIWISTKQNTEEFILYQEGNFSDPILLPCLENDGDVYLVVEIHD